MAFRLRGTGENQDKKYLQVTVAQVARGSRHFEYVTDDTPETFGSPGYISTSAEDGQLVIDMLAIGDLIWFWRVSSIDDERPIEEDKMSGVLAQKLYRVAGNDLTSITVAETGFGSSGGAAAGTIYEAGVYVDGVYE